MFFPNTNAATVVTTMDTKTNKNAFTSEPPAIEKLKLSFRTRLKASPHTTHIIPRMPATPKPGITKSSSAKRSEEHTSELQSLMRISYAVFCLKKKNMKQKRQSR